MSKKIKDNTVIRKLTMDQFEKLKEEVENFEYCDDHTLIRSSFSIVIYADGTVRLQGDFKSPDYKDLAL